MYYRKILNNRIVLFIIFITIVISFILLIGARFHYIFKKNEVTKSQQITSPNNKQLPSSTKKSPELTLEEAKNIPPFPPQELQVARLQNGVIKLEWYDADVLVEQFNVYKKSGNASWMKIGQIEAKSKQDKYSFTDKSVKEGTNYIYAVSAVNSLGTESEYLESGQG